MSEQAPSSAFTPVSWRLRTRTVDTVDHTLVMGIVNVTPDSFSDGGAFVPSRGSIDHAAAVEHALRLADDGADIIDVGGESTRPGADSVPVDDELQRVVPVVGELAARGIVVSIDTSKPEVVRAAVDAGAEIVNDVTGLRSQEMVAVCAELEPGVVVMHMQGTPRSMQVEPIYQDVVADVGGYLATRAAAAIGAGVEADRLCVDPGIGFGKTLDHNLALLGGLDAIVDLGYPVMLGTSRKSFLGTLLERAGRHTQPAERDVATAATAALAVAAGVAVVRVHDVAATLESTRVADAIVRSALNRMQGSNQ